MKIFENSRSGLVEKMLAIVKRLAPVDIPVLIRGETGSGKETVANHIHAISARNSGRMVSLNCAAVTESIIEAELFGHEKGSFTGAIDMRQGLVERADQGTLFLDEVGEMALAMQAKILRFADGLAFTRVGGRQEIEVDVRIISATNADLRTMAKAKTFREDLYYRLAGIVIEVPALRQRIDDIIDLAEMMRTSLEEKFKMHTAGFDDECFRAMRAHHWPGNVRELKQRIAAAVVLAGTGAKIKTHHVFADDESPIKFALGFDDMERGAYDDLNLERNEFRLIIRALKKTNWVQQDAAVLLGVTPRALNYTIAKFGITHEGWKINKKVEAKFEN